MPALPSHLPFEREYHRQVDRRQAEARLRRSLRKWERKRRAFDEDVRIAELWLCHGGRCGICGELVTLDEATVDHVIPLSRGGRHSYANTQPAHSPCNFKKGNRLPEEMAVEPMGTRKP